MARKSSSSPEPLVCEDPASLVKKCMKAVGRRLERAGKIGFKEIPHARGEREFLLLSTQRGSSARARQDYPALYFEATQHLLAGALFPLRAEISLCDGY